MTQQSLFAPDPDAPTRKPQGNRPERLKLLIVVKAAPNPSQAYGETVCVAALRLDLEKNQWVRLYPINFRALEDPNAFQKYDIVTVDAKPALADPRYESWRPIMPTLQKVGHLGGWAKRLPWVADHVEGSMCDLLDAVRSNPPARSLAAIHPRQIDGLDIEPHPGWTPEEQAKIDAYLRQESLFDSGPRTALEAPRFKAWYRYRCHTRSCKGHRQGVLDWEFVAHQRRLGALDDTAAKQELRKRWLEKICATDRDTVFFVGNQAKRQHVFSVLGAFYPRR
ncbi:hypothetical protein AB0K67_30475 [Nonomuraea sp. NPDC052634]|uniref:hypothetical protein n=1 Tax=Nonomuraea sp. NPDC052634 TaxID=3155813 RepID=UPI0034156B08